MNIDRVTFITAMKKIYEVSTERDKLYDKVSEVIGDSERIMEWFGIDDMISLLSEMCLDKHGFIATYIYENNWGKYNLAFKDKVTGLVLPFRSYSNLYDVLQYSQPWNLESTEV